MERRFENRKRELESECKVSRNAWTKAASRLDVFMEPFLVNYRRQGQTATRSAPLCLAAVIASLASSSR